MVLATPSNGTSLPQKLYCSLSGFKPRSFSLNNKGLHGKLGQPTIKENESFTGVFIFCSPLPDSAGILKGARHLQDSSPFRSTGFFLEWICSHERANKNADGIQSHQTKAFPIRMPQWPEKRSALCTDPHCDIHPLGTPSRITSHSLRKRTSSRTSTCPASST